MTYRIYCADQSALQPRPLALRDVSLDDEYTARGGQIALASILARVLEVV